MFYACYTAAVTVGHPAIHQFLAYLAEDDAIGNQVRAIKRELSQAGYGGEIFVANTVPEFAIYFPDHALIESLGCGSALNIPVKTDTVIGTVNILDAAHYFSPQKIASCQAACAQSSTELVNAMESYAF